MKTLKALTGEWISTSDDLHAYLKDDGQDSGSLTGMFLLDEKQVRVYKHWSWSEYTVYGSSRPSMIVKEVVSDSDDYMVYINNLGETVYHHKFNNAIGKIGFGEVVEGAEYNWAKRSMNQYIHFVG